MIKIEELKNMALASGYDLVPTKRANELYFAGVIPYLTQNQKDIIESCRPFTQTSQERLFALIRAVEYVVNSSIKGAMVECGVWKGGSVMAMAKTLDKLKESREIFLFDTFSGMPAGRDCDIDLEGNNEQWYRTESHKYMNNGKGDAWNTISKEDVENNLKLLEYTIQKFNIIQGRVEETIPAQAPETIALLRLDTDFYSSTKHELTHLFPRLVKGGVLIVDDYGHFLGSRKAVDEYFLEQNIRILMHRIDYTAIIGIKN